jgi:NAD(P)-dependent dehydrogenase (short-subunit alcohol dehydrogenase family)
LVDRVAIVTGGNGGIGFGMACGLAEAGACVVVAARNARKTRAAVERLSSIGPAAAGIEADVTSEADVASMVDQVVRNRGRIDILVNNAGTNPYFGPLIDADVSVWDKTFEVNLRGYFLLTQLVYRASMEQRGGAVLNIASTGGLRPSPGLGVYDVTKAGVVMLTRQLARELGGRVRVNCIAPGLFKTRFAEALWSNEAVLERVTQGNPFGRIGSPEEIAGAAVFLVSDASSYVNGQVLVIDGGGSGEGV